MWARFCWNRVLFQRHADELATGSAASLGKELLQRGLDRGLRNLQSISNLLIGWAFKEMKAPAPRAR